MKKTCFADPERAGMEEVEREVALASSNPVIDGVLKAVEGLLVIVNDKRQIIAVNDLFLQQFGLKDVREACGLRLGEVIGCVHGHKGPSGCGTTQYCPSCGVAVAMVTSLAENGPVERTCAVEVRHGEVHTDYYFKVRAVPITCDSRRFLLLILHDITRQHQLASGERVFFHDLKNILFGLHGAADLVSIGSSDAARSGGRIMCKLVQRLDSEIELQKSLSLGTEHTYSPHLEELFVSGILLDLKEEFSHHVEARGKLLSIARQEKSLTLRTDSCVLLRVLRNMVINALEATDAGGEVGVECEQVDNDMLRFSVWNSQAIPETDQLRIFQRNFSTKPGEGRGLGTWSMKFFGEQFLGGQVGFTSSEQDGTLFFLLLPRAYSVV